jgi:hypothetical protein
MKATNIYQTLKTKGYGTDGTKPQLPGVGSPLKKSPYKFNAGLKKAAAEGKLDNNPKFKDAVESSPAKLAPVVAAVGKKLLVGAAKKMIAKKAAEKLKQKQGSPAMLKNGNGEPKKKGPKKLDKKTIAESNKNFEVMVEAFAGQPGAPKSIKPKKASPAKKKDNGKKPKLISKVTDKKTGITTAKYDVGTNMPKIVKTKKSPVKKKGCKYKK